MANIIVGLDNDFLRRILEKEVKMNKEQTKKVVEAVMGHVKDIVSKLHEKDERFRNFIVPVGSYFQNLKVKQADEFDFNIPLDGFQKIHWSGGVVKKRSYELTVNTAEMESAEVTFIFTQPPPPPAYATYYGQPRSQFQYSGNASSPQFPYYSGGASYHPAHHQAGPPAPQPLRIEGSSSVDVGTLLTMRDDLNLRRSRGKSLEDPPDGFIFLEAPKHKLWKDESDMTFDGDVIPYFAQRRLKRLLEEICPAIDSFHKIDRKRHGPAITLQLRPGEQLGVEEIHVDFAVMAPVGLTMPTDSNWPRDKTRRWLTADKIQRIQNCPVNVVASKPYYWKLSFAELERELFDGMDRGNGCRRDCLRIAKVLRQKYWCKTTKPEVTSYILKNILLWECEDYPTDDGWGPNKLAERVAGIIRRLETGLDNGKIPEYFYPKINLLTGKDKRTLESETANIKKFMKDPKKVV